MGWIKAAWQIGKQTGSQFVDDRCMAFAAALSFYTALSLAPLLVILMAIIGRLWQREQARQFIENQVERLAGPEAGTVVAGILEQASDPDLSSLAAIAGTGVLLFAATSVFAQLQTALNFIWRVEADPHRSVVNFIRRRLISLGTVLSLGFLLLVSLVISTLIEEVGGRFDALGPSWVWSVVVSLAVFTLLFGAIFKVLPDVRITWRDVGVGGAATATMFIVGKELLRLYLANSAGTYRVLGSVVVVLIWVYYSSLILFLGAEFTQAWAHFRGRTIEPNKYAVPFERREERRGVVKSGWEMQGSDGGS